MFYGGGWIAAEWVEGPSLTKKVLIVGQDLPGVVQWTLFPYFFSSVPGAEGFVFGEANTAAITLQAGVGSYAAYNCENLTTGGYTDWYLPSIWELNMIHNSLVPINRSRIASGLGQLPLGIYWSSTQYSISSQYALTADFTTIPSYSIYSKNLTLSCLPVRITSI